MISFIENENERSSENSHMNTYFIIVTQTCMHDTFIHVYIYIYIYTHITPYINITRYTQTECERERLTKKPKEKVPITERAIATPESSISPI